MWWIELPAFFSLIFSLWGSAMQPQRGSIAVTEVVDRRGERIGFLDFQAGVNPRPLKEIPASLKELILLAEDRRFFQHHGVDLPRLIDALIDFDGGGASTITQQWVRIRGKIPRRWWTKPLVMALAMKVESQSSKEQILEAYLNHIPFGVVQGVGSAAEYYFAKPLPALSPGENAALAVLIRSPVGLSRSVTQLTSKRNTLLLQWDREGSRLAQSEPLRLVNRRPRSSALNYLEELARLAPRLAPARLTTTLDLPLQKNLEKILEEEVSRLRKRGVRHGALMVMDSKTGDVLSYIGSADYFHEDGGRIDGLQVPRQPGSLLKAFTYALAFDDGHTAATILPDTPGAFRSGNGMYRPRNYDERFTGPRRAREALANSLNLPALMLLDRMGPNRLHQALLSLGIPLKHEADYYGVGLTLGNAEITPLQVLQAFTAFPRGSDWVSARWFMNDKISTHKSPLTSAGTWMVSDILKDRHARMEAFGERTVFDVPFEMAAKTGTSTDYRDNWAVAWSTTHVAIAWVGNHDQLPMQRVSGITGAGPLVRATMLAVHQQKSPTPFIPPQMMAVKPICAISGMAPGPHCARVIDEKFISAANIPACDWHQKIQCESREIVTVRYPEEFQAWAHDHIDNQCDDSSPLSAGAAAITYPLNGAVFAVDPDLPRDRQRLPLKMRSMSAGLEWEVNGERLSPSADGTLDWPLERGHHVIRLVKRDQNLEEVKIFVR